MTDFSCCGGNDEDPPDHCMDCPDHRLERTGVATEGRATHTYIVVVTEVITRVVKLEIEAQTRDEAIQLGEYEAANGSLNGEEETKISISAERKM